MDLYAYNTRYEIHGYERGDIPRLEHDLSIYDKNLFLPVTFHYDPKYYLDEENKVLYIPRGYNLKKLEGLVGKSVVYRRDSNPSPKISFTISPPKNDTQKEAVRFLTGMEDYGRMTQESQLVLALPTGAGKTYCAIAACSMLEMKAMVIVGTTDLATQWLNKIYEYTNLKVGPKIAAVRMLQGDTAIEKMMRERARSLDSVAFYITTHSSLRNYMSNHGMEALNEMFIRLGVGIKIVDEAHLQYENTLMIDYAVNVKKNFYLTATFEQSDIKSNIMFQKAFHDVYKLQIKPEARKHVIWMRCHFNSHANAIDKAFIVGSRGTNKYNYIDYEMKASYLTQVFTAMLKFLVENLKIEGRILVISPKKESCDYFLNVALQLYPHYSACVHYTGSKVDSFEPYGLIFATYAMLGTGNDISELRAIINLEPIGSKRNAIQVVGRLREYAHDKDTYFIEPIDMSLPTIVNMANKREDALKDIVKDIKDIKF